MHIENARIKSYFNTNANLYMNAMKFAAIKWIDSIERELTAVDDPARKIKMLVRKYAYGTRDHPESLSSYIDLWKKIRMMPTEDVLEDSYIKNTLLEIYQLYSDFLSNMLDSLELSISESQRKVISWILVIVSDGIHIQELLGNTVIKKDEMVNFLYNVLVEDH